MKKITALLMSLFLIGGCFVGCTETPTSSNSSQNSSSQTSAEEDSSSSTRPVVPPDEMIQIRTEEELFAIKNDLGGAYRLMSDITLTKPWKTLGTDEAPFTGVFEGNDYTIRNMTVESDVIYADGSSIEYMVGMFGVLRGDVQNLTVDKLTISIDENTITASGYNALKAANPNATDFDIHVGLVASNKGNIEDVGVKIQYNVIPQTSGARIRIGGIAGKSNDKIADCSVSGLMTVKNVDGYIRAGGVAGYVSSNGKVKRSGASMDISTEITQGAKMNVGGVIGNIECGIVEDCFAEGSIFARSTDEKMTAAGGLIGLIDNCDTKYEDMSVTVTNSYSTMNVTAKGGKAYAAGFIGQIDFGAVTVVENNACSGVATGDKQSFGFVGRITRSIGIQLTADDLVDGKFGTLLTVKNNQSVTADPFATKVDSLPER